MGPEGADSLPRKMMARREPRAETEEGGQRDSREDEGKEEKRREVAVAALWKTADMPMAMSRVGVVFSAKIK